MMRWGLAMWMTGAAACVPPPNAPAPTPISALTVLATYEANSTDGDRLHNDKWRVLTGVRVDRIDRSSTWMQAGDLALQLTFRDAADVARLRRGDVVSARCEGDGIRERDVRFEHCDLLSRSTHD